MKKVWKRISMVVLVIVIILMGAGIYAGNMLYDLALNSKTDKSLVIDAPHNAMPGVDEEVAKQQKLEREQWFVDVAPSDKYLTSFDNLQLHAYEITNPSAKDKWVIVAHGYGMNAKSMIGTAKKFYELGFNVLMPDARGLGLSEGDYIGMGWDERRDMVQWSKELVAQDASAQIVLFGVSMGGATVMMTSGEADLPTNVKVVVEDCGYSSVWGEFSYQLKALFGLPAFPFMNFASGVTKVRAGFWLGEASAVNQVQQSQVPMLFIHGTDDTFVPASMLDEVYDAAPGPKEKYLVPGAGHGGASSVDPEAYWNVVSEFISQYVS